MIGGVLGDVFTKLPYFEKDPKIKAEKTKSVFEEHIMPALGKMEKKFAERGATYLIGDKLSYADLSMCNVLCLTENHDASYLKAIPKLNALKERVKNMDGIKQYYAKHPATGI